MGRIAGGCAPQQSRVLRRPHRPGRPGDDVGDGARVGSAFAKACHAMPCDAHRRLHSQAICMPSGRPLPKPHSPEETAEAAQCRRLTAALCVPYSAVRDWMAGARRRGKGGGLPRAHAEEYDGALRQLVRTTAGNAAPPLPRPSSHILPSLHSASALVQAHGRHLAPTPSHALRAFRSAATRAVRSRAQQRIGASAAGCLVAGDVRGRLAELHHRCAPVPPRREATGLARPATSRVVSGPNLQAAHWLRIGFDRLCRDGRHAEMR